MSDSLRPHELYSPWNSPGQNTGIGSLSLLQGIFPTQGSCITSRFFTSWDTKEARSLSLSHRYSNFYSKKFVLAFVFVSIIHIELIFVLCEIEVKVHFFHMHFHVHMQLFKNHLIKKFLFPLNIFGNYFFKKPMDHWNVGLMMESVLFHWGICTFLHEDHTLLILWIYGNS